MSDEESMFNNTIISKAELSALRQRASALEAKLELYDGESRKRLAGRSKKVESGCIEWQGHLNRDGYGTVVLYRHGKRALAHRMAWFIENGAIPDDMSVLHKCDNPKCINVEHLYIGTQADNVRDMMSRGRRSAKAGCRGAYTPDGELRDGIKLTQQTADQIRVEYKGGGVTQKQLSVKYGVSESSISMVIMGTTWNPDSRTALLRAVKGGA